MKTQILSGAADSDADSEKAFRDESLKRSELNRNFIETLSQRCPNVEKWRKNSRCEYQIGFWNQQSSFFQHFFVKKKRLKKMSTP